MIDWDASDYQTILQLQEVTADGNDCGCERYAAALPGLRFKTADVCDLPGRGKFDAIMSFNALHCGPERKATLRPIRSAPRPQDGSRGIMRRVLNN